VMFTCPARLHVRENDLGNLEMAASLDLFHFQQVGWKSFSATLWRSGKPPFPHLHHFHPYGGSGCPGHGRPALAVGA
jgi:hypothetical protein